MAASLYQFDIDDDSPEIAYFPFVNLEPSSNLSAGWQLLYSVSGAATGPGQVGVGTSYHYTSLDGASLMVNWNGTGIDLIGSVSNALYNVSLDGTPSAYFADPANTILASFDDLENTNHSLLLTTIMADPTSPDAFLTFDNAVITYAPPAGFLNATVTSQAIADADIAFMGQWSYATDSIGNSMHISTSAGDSAEITFLGSAITIYGLTSSYSGNFTVTLDNMTTYLSAYSSYNNSDSLLFYATDLPQDILHQIAVVNQENTTFALKVGGMNTTSFGNSTTSPTSASSSNTIPAGTIAAIVLAGVLFLVIMGILYYACCFRRKTHQHAFWRGKRESSGEKRNADIERAGSINPPSGEELESTSLSTSKGYGFGLGLRRGFSFGSRKNKLGSTSTGRSRSGTTAQAEFHPMTLMRDHDEKRLSIFTLTEDLPVLVDAPESEKLAPGWSNPVARTPHFKYSDYWKETQGISIPELRIVRPDDDSTDDADVKTLTSRQDETIAATLSLSPRTSEALATIHRAVVPKLSIDAQDGTGHSDANRRLHFLQVRDTSPFRIDVSAILGATKGNRDSGRTSESGSSTWSKVRSRLYRRAHRDDGRQSDYTDRQDTSSSSGPEFVPVVMHESDYPNAPSEAAPGSWTYSFLDLTPSHVSLRSRSGTTTLSSTPTELGHSAREGCACSKNATTAVVRIEHLRDDVLAPKPDAPSTASGGSHPSDSSGTQTVPSPPTMHTQISSPFPFPLTIPPSSHIAQPPDHVPERHITPSLSRIRPSESNQHLQVPKIASAERPLTPANSPTESVPFSVSDIYFRHSFSDHAGFDSQRASVSSALPPHPPLPHLHGSQARTPTYSPPPPYIVQRVLGLPLSPLSSLSPVASSRIAPDSQVNTSSSARQPEVTPTQPAPPFRVGSLLGPRPRPTTAGSVRGAAAPQLPMQGGRGSLRGRDDRRVDRFLG